MTDIIETALAADWRRLDHLPRGKCLLLTRYGIAVIGCYDRHADYIAWSPMPRIPEWAREMMQGEKHD